MLDRFEDHREFLVVFLLKRFDLASEIAIRVHEPAQLHECAHDGDVHLHCAGAAQYTSEHGDALLGKGVWKIPAAATAFL